MVALRLGLIGLQEREEGVGTGRQLLRRTRGSLGGNIDGLRGIICRELRCEVGGDDRGLGCRGQGVLLHDTDMGILGLRWVSDRPRWQYSVDAPEEGACTPSAP